MPFSCAIVNCSNRYSRDPQRFFRLPSVISHQGEVTKEKLTKRRRLWLAAINRTNMSETTINNIRVCSDHFISGKPSEIYQDTDPDWVPSVKMGYDANILSNDVADRYDRLINRKENIQKRDVALTLVNLSSLFEEGDHEVPGMEVDQPVAIAPLEKANAEMARLSQRLEEANTEIAMLKVENQKLKEEKKCLEEIVHKMKVNSPNDFENDDKVRYYTGLQSFVSLMALFNLLSSEISEAKNSSLNKFQKLIMTLMRLRLNLSIVDLSYRFGVSRSTISKTFLEMIHIMNEILVKALVRWPDRDELQKTMPMVFRKYFGRNVSVIIDCFEIFIDRPSNMTARAQTWSNYKHHNTAKYLIGITPQGTVSFISEGWGGRVSDKHLTANSNFLDHLSHGDLILADRGFEIQDLVGMVGAEVRYPSFTRGKNQLSATDVEETRKIANVRIHVERVIGTVRQKFTILGATCPIDYIITKPEDKCPVLDKVVNVCCALTNLCTSVVSFD